MTVMIVDLMAFEVALVEDGGERSVVVGRYRRSPKTKQVSRLMDSNSRPYMGQKAVLQGFTARRRPVWISTAISQRARP